jgi:hypothetical protein
MKKYDELSHDILNPVSGAFKFRDPFISFTEDELFRRFGGRVSINIATHTYFCCMCLLTAVKKPLYYMVSNSPYGIQMNL